MCVSGQASFFSPLFVSPDCAPPGSLARFLRDERTHVFPAALFADWDREGLPGHPPWPASVLLSALLLGAEETMARRAIARRLATDMAWRAAARLELDVKSPDESAFRRFERWFRKRDPNVGVARELLFHEHIARLALAKCAKDQSVWVIDGTPMWCYGAVHGTVRLVGDGIARLCRRFAGRIKRPVAHIASELDVGFILEKSIKGAFQIDWRDAGQRADVFDRLAHSALRVVDAVRARLNSVPPKHRRDLLQRCRQLARIVRDDFEVDEEGRLVIARRVAAGRTVSLADPQARSGRKTKSKTFKGFRMSVLGDAISGVICAVGVTPANIGEGSVAHRLIRRAQGVCGELDVVLGDTAYGGARLHEETERALGIDILAPPPKRTSTSALFGIDDFAIDMRSCEARCPNGEIAAIRRTKSGCQARWPTATCGGCSLAAACLSAKAKAKSLSIHPFHETRTALLDRWTLPETRARYRLRSQGERLVREQVRRGCRKARAWGIASALTQAYLSAARNNINLLAAN